MKLSLIFTLCAAGVLSFDSGNAQKNKKENLALSFYLFKEDWSSASNLDEAAFFMQMIKENDSLYICYYYNKNGPLVKQESYLDEGLSIPNGRFIWYNSNGDIDSIGLVYMKKKDSYWDYYSNNKLRLAIYYDKGKWIEKTDYDAQMKFYADGRQESFEQMRIKDSLAKLSSDTSFITVQVEAKYKGGTDGWTKYISKNLQTPDRLTNVLGRGTHTVDVCFLINKEGATDDIYLNHSVEWSGDMAIIQLIKNSPPWTPAQQNGRNVFYRQKQSISFEVD